MHTSLMLFADGSTATENKEVIHMVVLGLIMVATYVCIAFELMNKSLAALLGALLAVAYALFFGVIKDYDKAIHEIIAHESNVFGVLVGTSILVEIAGRSGLFHFLAIKIVKQTRGDPGLLFLYICSATVVFVTFLTIAPGTLIMVSLVLVVTKELDLDPKPYIIAVAISANSGALVTLASGVCTLMVGTEAKLAYVDFFRVTTPMALISAAIVYFTVKQFYSVSLLDKGNPEVREAKVAGFDEWALVKDRRQFFRALIILGVTIVGFAVAQPLEVGLDYIAFGGATIALLLSGESVEETIKKVNWSVILFFVGLFIIIGTVQASGLLKVMANNLAWLSGYDLTTAMVLLAIFVLVLSGLVDNIPVAATLLPIIPKMVTEIAAQSGESVDAAPLWWTLIIAANLGGNTTPVGSISSVIAIHSLQKERKIKIGWGEFLKVGCTVALIQGIFVIGYILLFQNWNLFPPSAKGN